MKLLYDSIYREMRDAIERGEYVYQEMLPSERDLVAHFGCSHNTLRRALALLRERGYVQPIHGKGVRVIWRPERRASFTVGGIESFRETVARNHLDAHTKAVRVEAVQADKRLAERTGYAAGEDLIAIERVRYLDGVAAIYDLSFFLASKVSGLTSQVAERSVYEYLERELGLRVAVGKRTITVERATARDYALLDLPDMDYLAVMTTQAFDAQGVLFEHTESRHRPDMFCFRGTAVRSAV